MKKWEYTIINFIDEPKYPWYLNEDNLNWLGKSGWELIIATKEVIIFKRELK